MVNSVRHGIKDDVGAYSVGSKTIFERIARIIDPLPGVTVVKVASDKDHQALGIIEESPVGRDSSPLFGGAATVDDVLEVGSLKNLIDVKIAVKDWMIERELAKLVLWKDTEQLESDIFPFGISPEIVKDDKPAPQEVLTEAGRVLTGQVKIAGLDDVDKRVVEELWAVNGDGDRLIRDIESAAYPAAETVDKLIIGFWVVGCPARISTIA
jgi:hypothetical protein